MTLSSDVALNNNRSTCKPGLFYVAPGCSGLTSQGNIAHLSQHQFRSVRRHTARKQQEHRILLLQSQLQQAHRALEAWEAWWYWHKEDYKRELLSFKPDCTEEPLDFCFKTTPKLDSCTVPGAAYVNDEGANLVTIKPDCTEESLDICFQTTIDSCNVSCAAHVDDEEEKSAAFAELLRCIMRLLDCIFEQCDCIPMERAVMMLEANGITIDSNAAAVFKSAEFARRYQIDGTYIVIRTVWPLVAKL